VTASVTGDGGSPVPLTAGTPLALRNMDVKALSHVDDAASTRSFTAAVSGPGGAASTTSPCWISKYEPDDTRYVDYHGNGTYTLTITTYTNTDCSTGATTATYTWNVGASVALAPPGGAMLTRQPNSSSTIQQLIGFAGNPGASIYEIKYELNGAVQPDGSLGGVPKDSFVDSTSGKVSVFESTPGTYVMVARAKSGDYYTPWSAPISFHLIAPFDFTSLTFPDSRGPSYKARATLGNVGSGKVSMAYAKGKKGRHFHGLGSAKLSSKGTFTRRFTLRHTGWYRLRFKYGGSSTVAGGTIYVVVHITRRIVG
jgi:hypothetical protein